MQSAVEKLHEYRSADYPSHAKVIELWKNILSKCDLSTLGDEKWLVLEQVFKSSLHCSDPLIAYDCIQQLNEHFEKTSPASITLNMMYLEFVGEFDKAKQISSTSLTVNEISEIQICINLINYLLHMCKRSYNIPPNCLILIENYCQKMTECVINNNSLDHLNQSLTELKDLFKSLDINENYKKEADIIFGNINSCISHLSVCYCLLMYFFCLYLV